MSDEAYWRETCPGCKTINWMWAGSNDVEAYQCYECGHKWIDEVAKDWIDDIEDAFVCEGSEFINAQDAIKIKKALGTAINALHKIGSTTEDEVPPFREMPASRMSAIARETLTEIASHKLIQGKKE